MEVTQATVKRSDGTVEIVEKNGAVSQAYVDAVLSPGRTLRTGSNGSAEIALQGGGAVRLEMDSELKLPEAKDKSPSQESLQMLKGRLFINIDAEALKKQGNREFRLKTPAAILAVKGTKFFVASTGQDETIGVHQGSVLTYGPVSRQTQLARAGTAVAVSGQKVSSPRPLTPLENAYDVMYGGTSMVAWVIPLGKGDRWLTLGCTNSKDGRHFYMNSNHELSAIDGTYYEKILLNKGKGSVDLAVDDLGYVYYAVAGGSTIEGKIYRLPKQGGKPELFCTIPVSDGLMYVTQNGKRISGLWEGPFAFGRTAEGVLDTNTVYVGAQDHIWRIARKTDKTTWSQPEFLYDITDGIAKLGGDYHQRNIGGIVMGGPDEIFILADAPNKLFRLSNWKDIELIMKFPRGKAHLPLGIGTAGETVGMVRSPLQQKLK